MQRSWKWWTQQVGEFALMMFVCLGMTMFLSIETFRCIQFVVAAPALAEYEPQWGATLFVAMIFVGGITLAVAAPMLVMDALGQWWEKERGRATRRQSNRWTTTGFGEAYC